jgi:hypothetical protein
MAGRVFGEAMRRNEENLAPAESWPGNSTMGKPRGTDLNPYLLYALANSNTDDN